MFNFHDKRYRRTCQEIFEHVHIFLNGAEGPGGKAIPKARSKNKKQTKGAGHANLPFFLDYVLISTNAANRFLAPQFTFSATVRVWLVTLAPLLEYAAIVTV